MNWITPYLKKNISPSRGTFVNVDEKLRVKTMNTLFGVLSPDISHTQILFSWPFHRAKINIKSQYKKTTHFSTQVFYSPCLLFILLLSSWLGVDSLRW